MLFGAGRGARGSRPQWPRVLLAIVVAGFVVFGYGISRDDVAIRWAGIALVAIALLARTVQRSRAGSGDADAAEGPADDDR